MYKALTATAMASLFLIGCSSDEETPVTHVTSSGVISSFGSVYVNGVRYITADSNIIANDDKSNEDALKVGMKVVINAQRSSDASTALEVKYLADAIGTIKAIDLAGSSLTILGQTYFITEATQFDDVLFNELRTGMTVELSAFENEYGQFIVSYLETKDGQTEQQLTGTISYINKVNKTFSIGQLVVNYAAADVTGLLKVGSLVKLKSKFIPIANEFTAEEVTVQGMLLVVDGLLEIAGIVEDLDTSEEFTTIKLDGRKYLLTDSTNFTQGDEDDLQIGSQVSLVATVIQGESETEAPSYPINSIRIELANEVSLEGIVQSVSDTSFTLFGREFTVDLYTQYEDDSEQELRYFTFSDIAIGDKLDVDAYEVDGVLISRNIEREETGAIEQDSYELEGVVDSIDTTLPSFSVKGITVITNGQTEFENALGNNVDQTTFFSTLMELDEVEVEITHTENGWLALEVEIDSDEAGDDIELVGRVDSVEEINLYIVNGHQVKTNFQTEFENGTARDLQVGSLIEVEGKMNSQDQLIAEEIEFIEAKED